MDSSMAAPVKVQSNRKIYDWSELEEAVTNRVRVGKPTPVSEQAFEMAERCFGSRRLAHLDERVLAVARKECIDLTYAHTSPGCGLESMCLQQHVKVFPAQGGRTSYEIDCSVNGYFANKHLPMRARDRGGKSQYRNTRWYYGQSGVYQTGIGPMYPDVGPACSHQLPEQVFATVSAAEWVPESWRSKAMSMVERLRDSLLPFGDAILRCELIGLSERPDPEDASFPFSATSWNLGFEHEVHSKYGLRVRIKHPAKLVDGGWEHVPNLCISVCGPSAADEDPEELSYVIGTVHAASGCTPVRPHRQKDRCPVKFCATRNGRSVIEAARQWCGNNLYIPA